MFRMAPAWRWLHRGTVAACFFGAPSAAGVTDDPERTWGEAIMRDWATNGQCILEAGEHTTGLKGKCGAQVAVLDLNRPSNGWDGIVGHVEFYMATTGSSVLDGYLFPFERHSMYELGSTTKAYTTTLTQILVDKGFLSWHDTIDKFFKDINFSDPRVANVTLDAISTHTSGLPPRPWNLPSESPAFEPYANYTEAQMLEFLRTLDFDHAGSTPKGEFIYCNDGFGLLGVVLERVMNKTYEELLDEYIFGPLGLNESSVDKLTPLWNQSGLVPLDQSRMSPGHDRYRGKVRVRREPYGIYKANGAVKSTAANMMRWMQAALLAYDRPDETEPVKAFKGNRTADQLAVSVGIKGATEPVLPDCPTPPLAYAKLNTNGHVARAWQNYWSGLRRIVWKSGNTRGFATFKAYDWARGKAIWGFDTCGGCDENKLDKAAMMMLRGPVTAHPPAPVTDVSKYVGTYYVNPCGEQDVDVSYVHRACPECHSAQVSLADSFNVSVSSIGLLQLQRIRWAEPVAMHPYTLSTAPAWSQLFPAKADPVAWYFTGPDRGGWINSEHKNKGRVPFISIDNRLAAQEVYFLYGADGSVDTMVFHSNGIDSFAVRDKGSLEPDVCHVGSSHWDGMCRRGGRIIARDQARRQDATRASVPVFI